MSALSKLQRVLESSSNLHNAVCGATTIASILLVAAFVNAARKQGNL